MWHDVPCALIDIACELSGDRFDESVHDPCKTCLCSTAVYDTEAYRTVFVELYFVELEVRSSLFACAFATLRCVVKEMV